MHHLEYAFQKITYYCYYYTDKVNDNANENNADNYRINNN